MIEGTFELKNAHLRFQFASADDLRCVGHNLSKFNCIGYWNNSSNHAAVEVEVRQVQEKIIASVHTLRNGEGNHPGHVNGSQLECLVRE